MCRDGGPQRSDGRGTDDSDSNRWGRDIWDSADQFHFCYAAVEGDFDVTVRVAEMDDTSEWAKAGLMVRQQLTANAENAMLRHTPDGKGLRPVAVR